MAKEVTIDVRMINSSGIGTYLRNLLPRVIQGRPDLEFHLIGNKEELLEFNWITEHSRLNIIHSKSDIYSLSEQIELLQLIPKSSDLLWVPHYNVPVLYKGKLLVTIHDVFHLAMTEFIKGWYRKLYARFMFGAVLRKSSYIINVSQFTKNELHRFFPHSSQTIQAIHNGVDQNWYELDDLKKANPTPYLLYVGNVKPHKNLKNLLLAFEKIKEQIPHQLVIIGKKDGFMTGDSEVIQKANSMGDRVCFTGFVEEIDLKKYFVNADLFVFPSFYEGFGLPPLEAMAAGCPTLVSHRASLPEVCGNSTIYFDPNDTNDLAEKILKAVTDVHLKQELSQKGLIHSRKFSWDRTARETLGVVEEVLAD